MNGRFKLSGLILVFLIFLSSAVNAQKESEIRTLYQGAKLKCVSQEWTGAITMFQKLLDAYPQSKYEDDAHFWIGYCLEKDPKKRPQAFTAFSQLISKYPDSPYVDDALGFQIDLAEKMIIAGEESYRSFLYTELKKDLNDIQYKAAIALGRIGDPAALPVLEKMIDNEDYGKLARDLAALLQINRMSVEKPGTSDREAKTDALFKGNKIDLQDAPDNSFLWFGSARYEQYQSMLKKENSWSERDLLDFGLWHIITTEAFELYKNLPIEAEKKEWRRKYWKRTDPTPTSAENEREQEFIRRVLYARKNFSELWESSEFNYMADQFLRPDLPHAPWDARGELYIKYGEPDSRTSQGWQLEVWTYYRYGIDFMVKLYMTNIYGKAIQAGEMSVRRYNLYSPRQNSDPETSLFPTQRYFGNWNSLDSFMQANFLFNNEMRYDYDYQANPIGNVTLSLEKQISGERESLVYHYKIPAGEFEMIRNGQVFKVRFREVFCVLDQEWREVARHDLIRNIDKIPDDAYQITEKIQFDLPAGKYIFYLRLEDLNEKNLGIFSQQFEVTKS